MCLHISPDLIGHFTGNCIVAIDSMTPQNLSNENELVIHLNMLQSFYIHILSLWTSMRLPSLNYKLHPFHSSPCHFVGICFEDLLNLFEKFFSSVQHAYFDGRKYWMSFYCYLLEADSKWMNIDDWLQCNFHVRQMRSNFGKCSFNSIETNGGKVFFPVSMKDGLLDMDPDWELNTQKLLQIVEVAIEINGSSHCSNNNVDGV